MLRLQFGPRPRPIWREKEKEQKRGAGGKAAGLECWAIELWPTRAGAGRGEELLMLEIRLSCWEGGPRLGVKR